MGNLLRLLPIIFVLFLSSCVFDKGTTFIDFGGKADPKGALESGLTNAQVTSISVVNDQLVINGSSLQGIESVKITDNGSFTKTFSIESKNSSQIISNGIDSLSIFVGQVFDLVIGNAYGQAVFPVTFTLQDNAVTSSKILDGEVMTADIANGAVTPAKLSTAGASAGSVLQFDGSNWNLINLNGLTYQGTWNANTNTPSFGAANCDNHNPGDYYAVSVSGSTPVDGESSWAAGDWIICSNGLWDKVINTTNITSVFGRTGAITAGLQDMDDVDSTLTSVDGQILIYKSANSRYETTNFIDFDWATGNVTFSNNLTVNGTGFTVGGAAVCLADGTNCTYPTPTSVVSTSAAAVVNANSGLDPIEFQIAGTKQVEIDTTGKLITNTFQVSSGAGAGKVLMSDVSGNGTWQDVAISNVTNLQTTLDSKVAKADVPACTDPTKQLVWDGTSWACLTFTDANTNAGTICSAGEYLDGDGTCKSVAASGADNSQAVNVQLNADNDSNSTGEIQFLTGATQQMVIDNSGKVGIGVLAPAAKLHVQDGAAVIKGTSGTLTVKKGFGTPNTLSSESVASFDNEGAGGVAINMFSSNAKDASIYFGQTTPAQQGYIRYRVDGATPSNQKMSFSVNGTERMKIDATGNVVFGAPAVIPLAGTLVTVGGTMKVSSGSDVCIDGGACLSTVDTNTTYTGGDGLTLTGTDFSVNIDGSTLETNLDIIRVKDAGITDAKIVGVGVQKVTSSAGNYLTYAPNGVACTLNQVLKLNASGQWVCDDDIDTTDHLGNHTATQDLDLANFKLVGNGGTAGVEIDALGNVGIGAGIPGAKLEVAGQVKITGGSPGAGKILTSDAAGLGSWQTPPSNTLIVDADNNTKIQVEESADENTIRFDTAGVERARIDALGNIIFGAMAVTPLAGTLVTVGGTMKVSSGSDVCIDGGACLSTVDTNTTYTGGDGLTLTGTDFAVNVDGSTLETNLDTLRVKDAGITDAKIVGVGVQKVTSSAGNYLTYAPNGVACTLNQVLKLDVSGQWICADDIDTTDNLGNHTATQNLDLANFKMVGNGGTAGVEVDALGNVGIGASIPGAKLEVAGQVKITGGTPGAGKILTSDAAGLGSWQTPPLNTLIVDADNNTKVQVEESADENIIRFDTAGAERARIDALGNIIFGASTVTPLAGTLVTVGGTMKVSSGSDVCIDGGACLSTVDTNTTYTGGDGLTLTGTDFAVNVDGSTLETNLDTLRVKDAGVTDAKIVGVGVQKVTSSAGSYLTYAPNAVACTLNQVLKLDASGQWICANDTDTTDNLGNHTATQNLDLANFKLVGNGGTTGIEIDVGGNVGVGTTTPTQKLDVNGYVKASKFLGPLISTDSRAVVTTPETQSTSGVVFDFKQNVTNGLNDGGTYNGVMTYRPYGSTTDWSGGPSHQIGFTQNGHLFHRSGSNITWNNWKKIIQENESGNVGIGTAAPASNLHIYQAGNPPLSNGLYANMILDTDGSNYQRIRFDKAGTSYWGVGSEGTSNDFMISGRINAAWSDSVFRIQQTTGNVGVGTNTPSGRLDIAGVDTGIRGLQIFGTSGNTHIPYNDGEIYLSTDVSAGATGTGDVNFRTYDGTSYTSNVTFKGDGSVGIGTASPTEKLDIEGDGRIIFGPNSTWGANLYVGGNGWTGPDATVVATNGNLHLESRTGAYSTYINWYGATGGLRVGNGSSGGYGPVSASAFTVSSDRRLKRDIEPLENSISKISKIKGVRYFYKDEKYDQGAQIGVIAQDVESVFPEAVMKDEKGFLSVNYPVLVGPLIEATKEQQRQIEENLHRFETMQGRVAQNEAKLKEQARKIASLEEENERIKAENKAIKGFLCTKFSDAPFCQ